MKTKRIALLTSVLFIFAAFAACSDMIEDQAGRNQADRKSDVPSNVVYITTAAALDNIRNNLAGHYVLTEDVDLSGYANWEPIGSNPDMFTGTLDGNGHTISNLTINISTGSRDYLGLFGFIGNMGQGNTYSVRNLTLKDCSLIHSTNSSYTGAIAGYNIGRIDNCSVQGILSNGGLYIGGITGYNAGEIINSRADVKIQHGGNAGGLAGNNKGLIEKSFATGVIDSGNFKGGFVGENELGGTIRNCYSTGDVNRAFFNHYGGFAGNNAWTIENCYSTGSVASGVSNYGGFAGASTGTVLNCYYDQDTSGRTDTNGGSNPKTTVHMKTQSTFTGWDFSGAGEWDIDVSGIINNGYPYLRGNEP